MGTCGKNGKDRTAEGVVEISKNPTDTTRRNKMKDRGIKKKKHIAIRRIVILCILAVLVLTGTVFSHFGGFGTGESADPKEFAAYAGQISEIAIPDNTRIIALGEATHGNREFQQLKLDVFQIMVEQYGVRAFALENFSPETAREIVTKW